jgi:hypothetical protein
MIPNLIHYWFNVRRRPAVIRDIFRKSVRSYETFLDRAEQRANVVVPEEYRLAWRNAFGLQRSLKKRQLLRFEALVRRDRDAQTGWTQLDDIAERLDTGWSEAEERDLLRTSRRYADVARSIEYYRGEFKPEMLQTHRQTLEQDSQYLEARNGLADRARANQERMKALLHK